MNPLSLCLAASLGLHGFLWHWGQSALTTPPKWEARQGEVAVELNLIPTQPAPPTPNPPTPRPEPEPPPSKPDVLPETTPEPIAEIPPAPEPTPRTETPPPPAPDPAPIPLPVPEPESATDAGPAPIPAPNTEIPEPTHEPAPPAPDINAAPEPRGVQQMAAPTLKASPVYPRLSRRRGEEGVVIIQLTVTAQGNAENIAIKQSSGYPLLDKAALKAIRQSTFTPAKRQGMPLTSTLEQTIEFKLEH